MTKQLCEIEDAQERRAFIERHSNTWRRLRDWLAELSHEKCWYTEATGAADWRHVDHFRPKNAVADETDGPEHGYWWLAFEWTNYRYSAGVPNTMKGANFRLCDSRYAAVTREHDLDCESPMMLDPLSPEDPALLMYPGGEGRVKEAYKEDEDELRYARANYTIGTLGLNECKGLRDGRRRIWNDCQRLLNECRKLIAAKGRGSKEKLDEKIGALAERLLPTAEYSFVAEWCLEANASRPLRVAVRNTSSALMEHDGQEEPTEIP